MRVLHLTTHTNIGGITTYIKRLVDPLKERGVETYVLSSGGERTEAFQTRGAVTLELPIKTKSMLHPKLWMALPKLLRILKENKIDMIHAHTRITQVMGAVASFFTGIPMVSTCHGFFKPKLGRALFPCWGKKIIAISLLVNDHLTKDFHIPADRVRLIYNAVNIGELERAYAEKNPAVVKRGYGFSETDPVVGIIARLVDDKGHQYLIKAASLLKKQFPNIRILIVGEGRSRKDLENLTAQLGLESTVHFCGNVNDITEPLAAMDVFALPATWREGFGLSIIEAMACHKPVIVTNIWSLNSLIENRVTGLMVEPRQTEPLAEAITELLTNELARVEMTKKAYALVNEHFAIERMASELDTLYREVLQGKS